MSETYNLTVEGFNSTEWPPSQVPEFHRLTWEDLTLVIVFCVFIIITVVGNTLVILAVITTRRLRTVTNCYVTSLAVADWLVGVFVMPPKVALHLMGSWELGGILCDIWISLDVLCCTASILSLCAISVDRYLAVTQPLNYSRRRRSKKLALLMILVVWLVAIAITCPPILGCYLTAEAEPIKIFINITYNTWVITPSHINTYLPCVVHHTSHRHHQAATARSHGKYDVDHHKDKICRYNQNEGYVIFSAMGSFFIPLIVMLYVYARISCVVAKRHDKLRQVQNDSKKGHKLISYHEESDCMERTSCDGEEKSHPPIVKSTSLSNSDHGQYSTATTTTTLHPQRSIRSHQSHYSYQNHHSSSTELCGPSTRLNYYGGGSMNRSSRPESLIVDLRTGDHSCSMRCESSSRVSSFRRESKTTQTLTIVVGGFVACWLPFFVIYLITPFLPECTIPGLLMSFLTWLGWFNSAINPFIYAFYSVDFRTAFWRLTFRHCSNTQKWQQQFLKRNK